MAFSDIDAYIDAKVASELGGSYAIQYDNEEAFTKPDAAVYLRAFSRYGVSDPRGIESGAGVRYTLMGTLEFQVIGFLGEDKSDVNAAVNAIIAAFAYKKFNVGDAENSVIRFQNPSPLPVGRVNGRYQVNVPIVFWVDLVN